MNKKYLLAIDQGTTSSRAIIFDYHCNIISQSARRHEQIYPQPGYVSHNMNEIFFNVLEIIKNAIALAGIEPEDIAAMGIANQRETVALWDKITGEPVCDAIVWQCRRTADICRQIVADGFADELRQKTGLLPDPYFSATKIKWIMDNIPEAKALLKQNRLLAGTVDSYIIWRLTNGEKHVTDYTNASRTMLFNIHELKWDTEMLRYFDIPAEILPQIIPSSGLCGYTEKGITGGRIPIMGVAGDQHAALFGQCCFDEGDMKNTYGTGCFILANTGDKAVTLQKGLLTTMAWYIDKPVYALEGSIFCAGTAIEWLINELRLIENINELEYILGKTPSSEGVYFVPAFTGLSAPDWDMNARGTITGMSLASKKEHIVRAVCEAIAYQSKDVLDYMANTSQININRIKVDGGVSRNNFIMQFQADISGIPVIKSGITEITALGAAYLAGLAAGIYKNTDEIKALSRIEAEYKPKMNKEERAAKYEYWRKAVERSKDWLFDKSFTK